ncbi:FK506-binding protein 5-like [Anopheles bellator]|uniref:FK506-binding protein 5-like n=1 Tax=Anopheles bellator TaxID=139047 RepID=UPI0026488CFA|nr:FK506-binding protein 5-like [Anopheles bellator]
MNLNERIISTQLFAQTIDETATTTTSVGSSVGLSVGFAPFVAAATAGLAGTSSSTTIGPAAIPAIESIDAAVAGPSSSMLVKQSTETVPFTSPHRLHPNSQPPVPTHLVASPKSTGKATGKSRSLSTGSYITKDSSTHSSAERLTKSNSNTEVHWVNHGTVAGPSVMAQNKSLEEGRSMISASKASPPVRKPILRKSKKIVRTDSEFLQGNIYEKESSVSSSQYTPTRDRRREQFADYRSSNPSSETHKSTDESSKNMSTDEIDTVFSDTMDLEQLEQDYRMHLKNNLQREYKSDSDTLDEVGKKRAPDYNAWKNQSYENTFDGYAKETAEQAASERTKDCGPSDRPEAGSVGGSKKDRPTDLELGSASDGGCKSSSSTTADGPFGHLFEKNLGRFKRMNKLLRCKRFSTSALYERKSTAAGTGGNGTAPSEKPKLSSPTKSTPNATRSPEKSILSQSKASISSSKSSLFGTKKPGTGFTFKGKKFLFTGKSSPNKSKSNSEISYYRTKSTKNTKKGSLKNNSTACLNLETTCTSPLSEAFYNTTGSVRLSAMELYEKFCSQDFSGLYKHETVRPDTDGSGTDSSHYDGSGRQLGAIRKYRRRNFKLLRQKSEPKFSFRTDTLYEDSYDGVCYHDEKDEEGEYGTEDYNQFLYDEQYYEEDLEHFSIEHLYYQRNGLVALPDGTFVQRYGEPDDGDEEQDEEEEECEEEVDEEEEVEEEEEELGEEEELEEEEEDDEELEEDRNEQIERRRLNRLQLPPAPPIIECVPSMDSDCDEIYLMPQNDSTSRQLIIQDFLFHHSNNEFDGTISADDYDIAEVDEEKEEGEGGEQEGGGSLRRETSEEEEDYGLDRYAAAPDKETLTIYKICSKESILESIRGSAGTPEAPSVSMPHSASMEQYVLRSDCVTTLERTASLDLLSNSSGTQNKSTLTDYAFDTVRNINLDSCSTSRLSLSLKSEIFEEATNGSPGQGGPGSGVAIDQASSSVVGTQEAHEVGSEVPRIRTSWNIEDFTLTPEESFSDEQLPLDGPLANRGPACCSNTSPACEQRLSPPEGAHMATGDEMENENSVSNAQYTIVDLDEEPYLLDPSISQFTSEITKEFDLLFSRAETESLAAAAAAASAATTPTVVDALPVAADGLGDVLKLLSDLPTRYSMQMLEHINLDVEDIRVPCRDDEPGLDNRPTQVAAADHHDHQPPPPPLAPSNPSRAPEPQPVSAKPRTLQPSGSGRSSGKAKRSNRSSGMPRTTGTTPTTQEAPGPVAGIPAPAAATTSDRLAKARSQSLGNLKNKTKCFPL